MSIYLKIEGVTGSVSVANYENTIEIFNYDIAASRSVNERAGLVRNRSVGLVKSHSLSLAKAIDKSSTTLLHYFYSAKVIPEIKFYHLTTGSSPKRYLVNTFYDSLISRFEENNHSEGVIERIEMTFSRYEKRNMPLNKSMQPTTPQTVGYDLEKATLI